jgi:hypothetical protein
MVNIQEIVNNEIEIIENDENVIENNEIENVTIDIQKCTICLEQLSLHKWKRKQCGGEFHKICIREWRKSHINYPFSYTCPLCNQIIRTRICKNKSGFIQCVQIALFIIILTLCSILFFLFTSMAGMTGWILGKQR